MAKLLDGKQLAAKRRQILKDNIACYTKKPQLAVILLGEDHASKVYVTNKRKACEEVGIISLAYDLPLHTSQDALLALIEELNINPDISGILVQLPLPAHIDTTQIIEKIHPNKDVDGFHPYNLGRLAQRIPRLRPCTPLGVLHLLDHYQIPVKGRHAVVVGASNIVGRPMSLEFLLAGSTVTICHKFTRNLEYFIRQAEILVIATGVKDIVDANWLHKDQVVVDVGIHRLDNGSLRGDIDFAKACDKVAWITPVPGGVGPMTIVTLMENTLLAASWHQS